MRIFLPEKEKEIVRFYRFNHFQILQLAIVSLNDHAFRNRNINYMIAEETIHLPSINQISKLMKGIKFDLDEEISYKNNNIYYFGG